MLIKAYNKNLTDNKRADWTTQTSSICISEKKAKNWMLQTHLWSISSVVTNSDDSDIIQSLKL